MSDQTTPQTPQTTPQAGDAWGQAQTELGQQAPSLAQTQSSQPQQTSPQTNDAWGQAQSELSGQQNPPVQTPMDADKSIGPEERQFLKNNPTYKYLPKDPRFPNREPGIYPMGPGNEWRNDPNHPNHDISQAPVDLHLVKHSLEGAAIAAAGVAPAVGLAALPEVIPSVLPHTIEGVKAIGAWATKNPVQAYILYNVIKDLIPGTKRAIGLVKGVPEP